MTFGKKLQNLRNEKKLSQEQIAEYTGVSRQAVSKWENDLSYPDTKNLVILADIFNISMDELLNLSIKSANNRKDETEISIKKFSKNNILVNIILVFTPIILYLLIKRYIPTTVSKNTNIDIRGGIITLEGVTFLILGIFNIFLGFLIKKFELANFLTFYNPKKDEDIKNQIEKIAGDSFSLMGVFMILLVVLGYFTNMNQDYFVITQASIILGFALLMILKSRDLRKNQ